jgi:hypothetical protein
MEKRILITGITLALSIIIIISIFFIQTGTNEDVNPVKSIPQDAALILKLNGFHLPGSLIKNKTRIWSNALDINFISKLDHEIRFIDSLLSGSSEHHSTNEINSIYISGHLSGGKKIMFLSIFNLSGGIKEKDVFSILKKPEFNHLSYTERKYESKTIYTVHDKNSQNDFYLSIINGMATFSRSPILIENSIRQSALSTSLLDDHEFCRITETTGKNKDANLYINLKNSDKFLSLFGNKSVLKANKAQYFGSWLELDINLKENLLLLNGFALKSDTLPSFISMISDFDPVKIEVEKVLPASISAFISFSISVPDKNYKSYKDYLNKSGKLATYNANLKNMNSKYKINFDEKFLNLMKDEFTLAYKEKSGNLPEAFYLLLKCNSGSEARGVLSDIASKLKNHLNNNLEYTYSPDNEVSHKIYNFPIHPLFGRLLGDFFNVFEDNYLTVYENYIIVSDSYKNLARLLYDNMLQKTLHHDEVYQNFASSLSMKSYMLIYTNLSRATPVFKNYFSDKIIKGWKENINVFQKLQTAGVQISEVSNMPYFNILVKYHEDYRGKPRTVWESLLDTTLSFKPKFVENHYTKQNEIVVQDDSYKFYLLNQSGRILWKTPLNEKINSEIYQIDYYKNGKLQILFSTENAIHLLDRNGNYVERFPVKLRAKSSAGMSLFDYDKNKNYRIFIPCTDKKIYAYTKEGAIINGWTFKGSDYIVRHPVNHFRVADKDFIVFGDESYTYIVDRKGNTRIKLAESISKSKNNNYYLYNNSTEENSFFVTSTTDGTIVKIFLSGKVSKLKIRDFSPEHFFDFKDINADGFSDYIFLDQNVIYVYNHSKKEIFKKKFNEEINLAPVYYHFSFNDRKLGLVSQNQKIIHLLNNNGEEYKGFPLEGSTQFSIGYFDMTSSRFNLIVGGRNNFLYNYTVE